MIQLSQTSMEHDRHPFVVESLVWWGSEHLKAAFDVRRLQNLMLCLPIKSGGRFKLTTFEGLMASLAEK